MPDNVPFSLGQKILGRKCVSEYVIFKIFLDLVDECLILMSLLTTSLYVQGCIHEKLLHYLHFQQLCQKIFFPYFKNLFDENM